jgi:signal transduction histidine kinase
LTAGFLADAALVPHVCVTIHEVSGQMQQGAGVVLLTEESLTTHSLGLLARSLMTQPTWSDIPIILLTSGGGESPINTEGLASLSAIGNVSLIERPVRMMTLLSSITAALRARNRQYDVREHLEREVRNKKEIEKAFIQVEEASRLKDEFLATVSHELRTPLNAVLGWTTLLRSNSLDEAGRQRAVETIERNARSQTQLVEDLLDVSRAISGKLRLDAVPIEPRRFIEEAVEALRPTAQARQVRVTEKIEANLDAVYGDPARLRQIVWNLLSNAIKFTARGGRIRLTARRVAANLEIAVMDNGQGIAPEFLPYVFERFRQADMTTTRTHGGLGLGLAIVRQLVELHSGTVGVTSAGVGGGATFTIMLPLITTHQRAKSNGKRSEKTNEDSNISRALRGVRVLVVDDEADTRDLLKAVLSTTARALPQHRQRKPP